MNGKAEGGWYDNLGPGIWDDLVKLRTGPWFSKVKWEVTLLYFCVIFALIKLDGSSVPTDCEGCAYCAGRRWRKRHSHGARGKRLGKQPLSSTAHGLVNEPSNFDCFSLEDLRTKRRHAWTHPSFFWNTCPGFGLKWMPLQWAWFFLSMSLSKMNPWPMAEVSFRCRMKCQAHLSSWCNYARVPGTLRCKSLGTNMEMPWHWSLAGKASSLTGKTRPYSNVHIFQMGQTPKFYCWTIMCWRLCKTKKPPFVHTYMLYIIYIYTYSPCSHRCHRFFYFWGTAAIAPPSAAFRRSLRKAPLSWCQRRPFWKWNERHSASRKTSATLGLDTCLFSSGSGLWT